MCIEFPAKVVKKSVKNRYTGFTVSIPKRIADAYGLKGGEILHVRIAEMEIDGRRVKVIVYYKP